MAFTPVPMRFDEHPLLWVVDDVYSQTECSDAIRDIERSAPKLATNNPMYRDQDRVVRDDEAMASELFRRLRQALGELRVSGLNGRLRFYRYSPGQRFAPHMDHWYQPSETRITLLTVLVYFNDDFEGGRRSSSNNSMKSWSHVPAAWPRFNTRFVTKAAR